MNRAIFLRILHGDILEIEINSDMNRVLQNKHLIISTELHLNY
jgi:hypothetical protein